MSEIINDERFLRILNALGLRGIVQHVYEPTVAPVLIAGEFAQQIFQQVGQQANPPGAYTTVPKGETWELLLFSGGLQQAAGTVAPNYRLAMQQLGGVPSYYPFFFHTAQELVVQAPALNTSSRFSCRFPVKTYLTEGMSLLFEIPVGDGTFSYVGSPVLVFRRFLERLLENQP